MMTKSQSGGRERENGGGSRAWAEVTGEEDADLWLVGGRIREAAGKGGCVRRGGRTQWEAGGV